MAIPSSTYTTNGNGVLYVAIPGFTSQKVILTATVGDNTYTFTKKKSYFRKRKVLRAERENVKVKLIIKERLFARTVSLSFFKMVLGPYTTSL